LVIDEVANKFVFRFDRDTTVAARHVKKVRAR
jgi:hypothetical protein